MAKIYRATGTRLGFGVPGVSHIHYSTAEEAWMRAQDDGIYPEGVESQEDSEWLTEAYTPPVPALYIEIYNLYAKGILGD